MAKDPAFLFYFQDFAFGTRRMDRRHKGAYVDLLIEQADLFARGKDYHMSLDKIIEVLENDFDCWEKISEKFVEKKAHFFNLKLLEVQTDRKNYSLSRKNNRMGKGPNKKDMSNISDSYDSHMEDVIEDVNVIRIVKEVISDLNQKAGTNYKHTSAKTRSLVRARVNDGFTEKDFFTVHDKKVKDWLGTEHAKYLRPETLYSNKFEGYLNQLDSPKKESQFL